ncbi:MAG: hypothetical protein GOU98_03470 [Candidatus Altiarchaeota archaeon]|nr:hypothetical protein [Candidatus Altiarchaeota archaeon]
MKYLTLLFLLGIVYAACGDKICEVSEIGSCRDCSTINPNGVCDEFTDNLKQFDPDCNTTVGQACYDTLFTYSFGKGNSCYPGNCTESSGCGSTCSVASDCESGFCVGSTCSETCGNCTFNTTDYEVWPLSTTVYLGEPTFVSFRINRVGSGPTLVSMETEGPCTLTHETEIDLGSGYSVGVIKIDACLFSGLASIKLTVNSNAWGSVHFLSYPALIYQTGDMPRGVVGFSSMAAILSDTPVEVKTWVG